MVARINLPNRAKTPEVIRQIGVIMLEGIEGGKIDDVSSCCWVLKTDKTIVRIETGDGVSHKDESYVSKVVDCLLSGGEGVLFVVPVFGSTDSPEAMLEPFDAYLMSYCSQSSKPKWWINDSKDGEPLWKPVRLSPSVVQGAGIPLAGVWKRIASVRN